MSRRAIGAMRERLTLETPTLTDDGGGGSGIEWAASATLWGEIRTRGGSESLAHHRHTSTLTHEIRIRYRTDIEARMRLRSASGLFEINAVMDPDGRRRWLVCRCEEVNQ